MKAGIEKLIKNAMLKLHQYLDQGKYPITISCRFTNELVYGQQNGEWIDKTFLGQSFLNQFRFWPAIRNQMSPRDEPKFPWF